MLRFHKLTLRGQKLSLEIRALQCISALLWPMKEFGFTAQRIIEILPIFQQLIGYVHQHDHKKMLDWVS